MYSGSVFHQASLFVRDSIFAVSRMSECEESKAKFNYVKKKVSASSKEVYVVYMLSC